MHKHNSVTCPLCGSATAARDDATIADALITSGSVVFVCGIDYAAFEEIIRPVFSQMPSGFENHSGACFLPYKSGGGHNFDFTLVVAGKDNEYSRSLLRNLMPRVQRMVVIGPLTRDESHLIRGGSVSLPPSFTIISAVAIGDRREYFVDAMKSALRAVALDSKL